MSGIEYANRTRGADSLPPGWGEPPSEKSQRSAWILKNIHTAPTRSSHPRSAEAALAKADYLAGKRDLRRDAHLALWRAEELARSSTIALALATHLALRPAGHPCGVHSLSSP
jgi:hypothetical protein